MPTTTGRTRRARSTRYSNSACETATTAVDFAKDQFERTFEMSFEFQEVAPGQPVTASWANSLVRAVRRALNVSAASPLEARADDSGISLSLSTWPRWELCELSTTLSAGGQAQARLQTFDFATSDWIDLSAEEVSVHDSLGDKNGAVGRRAWIYYSPVSARWEVIQLQCN
jgi:hypothetical protein